MGEPYRCPKCTYGGREPSDPPKVSGNSKVTIINYSCGAALQLTQIGCSYYPVWTKVCGIKPLTKEIQYEARVSKLRKDDAYKEELEKEKQKYLFELRGKLR